jgi:tetratricopeptide (TPR) repeat protein
MEALLQNLTPAPKRRRRLVALGAIGVLGAAALAWVGMRPTPCRGAAEHLRGVWDQARREAMAASFEAVGTPFARNVWARESPRVDAYARSWAEMHTRACEMTRVTGEQSEAVLDLRMACLQQARMELVAALDVMQTPDDDALEHAHEIVGGLPELARCADGPRLQAVFDPPAPAEEAAVGAIREQIARSRALVRGGKFDEGLAEAQGARDALGMIEYGPVRTEVLLAIGGAQVKRQDDDAAAAAFREAHASATEHGQWENAVEAAGLLAFSLGARGSRFAEAHVAIDLGIGLARRIDDPETIARFHSHRASVLSTEADYEAAVAAFEASLAAWDDPDGQRAETHRSLGITYLRWGKFDEAEAEIRRALELRIEKLGSEHPDVAMTYHTLGNVLREQGQLDEAGAAYEEAIAIADATMPGHPETALLRQSKGAILVAQGKPDEAEQLYRTILAEWEPKLGAEHTTIAAVRNNLAGMLLARGETNGALELLRAVLDGRARTMGEEHPSTLSARGNVAAALLYGGRPAEAELELRRAIEGTQKVLGPQSASLAGLQDDLGTALADQGRYAEAEPAYRAAIAILEREFSRDHIELGGPMNNLGTVLFAAEKYEEAGKAFEDALRIFEGSLAPNHPNVAMALVNVGNVARARREWDHAIPPLERAVNIYESGPAPPSDRGEARYRLGAGLWESGRDRKRAARLLAAARVDFAAAPEEIGRKAVAELDAYLREQRIEIEVLVETATEATR